MTTTFYDHWRDVPVSSWRWPNFSPAEIACRGTGKLLINEPALDKLQQTLGGKDFEVVAINIDTRDPEKPKTFLKEAGLTTLTYFHDQKAKVFQDLKSAGRALGMPTSVLVDGAGCEIGTIAGPAEWASEDAIKLIKAATAK